MVSILVDRLRQTGRHGSEFRSHVGSEGARSSVAGYARARDCRPRVRTKLKIELNHPQNFERLVLGCMDSYDSESRLIFQHFSRSTRLAFLCTAQTSKIQFLISTIFEKLKIEISISISKCFN